MAIRRELNWDRSSELSRKQSQSKGTVLKGGGERKREGQREGEGERGRGGSENEFGDCGGRARGESTF